MVVSQKPVRYTKKVCYERIKSATLLFEKSMVITIDLTNFIIVDIVGIDSFKAFSNTLNVES